ncbi:PAS fold [Shimia gijangensis]|uniref:PAS fold n=1 Tax=Shimia gijangensis TaxID=1470563 RepID=A0A1M6MU29_9RHOB|nr:PAS-domain containing protein [Shimia gijangensis]SHJ86922.1 PAS fold [Shimia gijangensis]
MMDLGMLEGVLLVSLSFGLALVLIWLANRLGTGFSQEGQGRQHTQSEIAVFLFQSGVLLDANPVGQNMLCAPGEDKSDWSFLADLLLPRFPSFPATQGDAKSQGVRTFSSTDDTDQDFVLLDQWDDMARVTLSKIQPSNPVIPLAQRAPSSGHTAVEAPYPVWQSNQKGEVEWANKAYFKLAENLGLERSKSRPPSIFDQFTLVLGDKPVRCSVVDASRSQSYWFDVTTTKSENALSHFATDANAIVNAEIAQRNFVQTLTKTFAQLSIGLAIFDRNRQLALFNPALIDLTALPADFLSSRPNLLSVFDRMRENRMMPEPRNYSSWREQIAELVVAASDDRYTETWTLPSGVTYRVMGRPHPDGAIAFLFEDISAEVSLTRRFRADLELGKSTLDSLKEAIAVFAPTGGLSMCNLAYRELWNSEPESGITEYGFQDAIREWRAQSEKSDVWERLRHHILDISPRENWSAPLRLLSGQSVIMRVVSLTGGFTSIVFDKPQPDAKPKTAIEIMAG